MSTPFGETKYELFLSLSVVIAANRTGVITVGPDMALERWVFKSTQVSNNGSNVCTVEVYDSLTMNLPLEGTYSGRLDQSNTEFVLNSGQHLYYRWRNATPGSTSTLVIRGDRLIKGRRGGGL